MAAEHVSRHGHAQVLGSTRVLDTKLCFLQVEVAEHLRQDRQPEGQGNGEGMILFMA